jgi:hypothetical protein
MKKSCPCCNLPSNFFLFGAISPFYNLRVKNKPIAELVEVNKCPQCETFFYNKKITKKDLEKLYINYRNDLYFLQRNKLEPWYTLNHHKSLGSIIEFDYKTKLISQMLAENNLKNSFKNSLDHGGSRGEIYNNNHLKIENKYIYDISNLKPLQGVKKINEINLKKIKWDLVISTHVLEHIPNPYKYIQNLCSLGSKNTLFIIEVPNETFKSNFLNKNHFFKFFLKKIIQNKLLFKFFHFTSSFFRIKFKYLPPLTFPILTEHLIYFSFNGLVRLLERANYFIIDCKKTKHDSLLIIARKAS